MIKYAKNSNEGKYQYLINKRQNVGSDQLNHPKAFIEYANHMQDIYKNIKEYNPGKKCKVLIVFDDVIAEVINKKKLNPKVTGLFIRGRKLNISIFFISHSYFKIPKEVRLNSMRFLS